MLRSVMRHLFRCGSMGVMSNTKRDLLWALKVLAFLMALVFTWAGFAAGEPVTAVAALIVAAALGWFTFRRKRPTSAP